MTDLALVRKREQQGQDEGTVIHTLASTLLCSHLSCTNCAPRTTVDKLLPPSEHKLSLRRSQNWKKQKILLQPALVLTVYRWKQKVELGHLQAKCVAVLSLFFFLLLLFSCCRSSLASLSSSLTWKGSQVSEAVLVLPPFPTTTRQAA